MSDTAVPDGYKQNAQGALVPIEKIKPEHLLEDELVNGLVAHAQVISRLLSAFKARAFDEVDAYVSMLAQEYGAKLGGAKGNITLTSFDGQFRLQIAIGDRVELGPELQVAKTLIDTCIRSWSEGANSNLRTMVMDAFQVDKQGQVDTQRILGLRRLQIDDANWKQAMEAIANSVRITSSKRYVRFYIRGTGADAPEVQIAMDLARVAPAVPGISGS